MNWQAEFLDNPEIRLTFDHFPFFSKARNYGEQIQFRLPALRLSGGDARRGPGVGGGGSPGRRPGVRSLFQIPGRRAARLRAGRFSAAATRRARCFLRACAPNGRCCSMPERAMPTIRSRRWPSLRSRPSGSAIPADSAARCFARCGASPEVADPYHHVRCGRSHGGGFGRAAASFHVPVIIRFAITLRFRCSLPKIFCTRTTTF